MSNGEIEELVRLVEAEFRLTPTNIVGRHRLDAVDLGKIYNQRLMAFALALNFKVCGVDVQVEGIENLPEPPYVIAMNHTDPYSYWPLQFKIWRERKELSTVWIKGKYIDTGMIDFFMGNMGMLPIPSRGYVIKKFFEHSTGKKAKGLSRESFGLVCDVLDGKTSVHEAYDRVDEDLKPLVKHAGAINIYHEELMIQAGKLTREVFDRGLYLIVFPEGTRNKNLSGGKTGLAELALHTGVPVVPVGCNGGDVIYPGWNPFATRGTVVYRIGQPLMHNDAFRDFHIPEGSTLFSRESRVHMPKFEGATHVIMEGIHSLLDECYQNRELYPVRQ